MPDREQAVPLGGRTEHGTTSMESSGDLGVRHTHLWGCSGGCDLPIHDCAEAYKAGRDGLDAPAATHEPGDHHRYRIECEVCGERGTIRLSVDPDLAAGSTPEPTRWKYDSKCEVTDEDHERGEACQGSMPHSHRSGKIKWARLLATPSDTPKEPDPMCPVHTFVRLRDCEVHTDTPKEPTP